jgi:hypothetical protein
VNIARFNSREAITVIRSADSLNYEIRSNEGRIVADRIA